MMWFQTFTLNTNALGLSLICASVSTTAKWEEMHLFGTCEDWSSVWVRKGHASTTCCYKTVNQLSIRTGYENFCWKYGTREFFFTFLIVWYHTWSFGNTSQTSKLTVGGLREKVAWWRSHALQKVSSWSCGHCEGHSRGSNLGSFPIIVYFWVTEKATIFTGILKSPFPYLFEPFSEERVS